MSNQKTINVALIGNPNTGKTSLFNQLTGLNQKVGNYPGVTVDKKEGSSKLSSNLKAIITDLPGTYSINPTSLDESIVLKTLLNSRYDKTPDIIVVVADIENLKRNLLLFSQIKDLAIPTVLAINMADQMKRKGITVDLELLERELGNEVVLISVRKDKGKGRSTL
jgi:ferrous iron transport protein B